MKARRPVWIAVLASLLGGCGGAQDRPEPPSGAVDLGAHGLATPGSESARGAGHHGGDPSPGPGGLVPGLAGGLPGGAAGAPARRPGGDEPVSETTGKIVMTREHCETLGRKFSELALAQGGALGELGAGSAGEQEAAAVGKTFGERCARDLAGQTVEAREYQCMLRARTTDDLLGCRR